jgi:hypothetical protein
MLLCLLQVCGVSVVLAGLSYPLSRFWYTRNWRRLSENELFEQKMLRWGCAAKVLHTCCQFSCIHLSVLLPVVQASRRPDFILVIICVCHVCCLSCGKVILIITGHT